MNFVAGSQRHALELPGGIKATPFICYEIIFPDLVAVDAASTRLIVNVTNDAWFGETPGPYQHFRQAQVRSVENGVPLLRAANTGISGVVDSRGRIVDALAMNVRGVVDVELSVPEAPPASLLRPRINALAILLFFAAFAAVGRARQRLWAN
jgi:apolipoprotein N-acyltransferase